MDPRPVRVINLLPAVLIGFGVFVLLGAASSLSQPLLLIALAVIIATALNPIVTWANMRFRVPRAVGAAVILFLVLGGLFLLLWGLIPALVEQLSSLVNAIPGQVTALQAWLEQAGKTNAIVANLAENLSQANLAAQASTALSALPRTLLSALGATTGLFNGLLLGILLLIMGFAVLVDPTPLLRGAIAGVPPRFRDEAARALARIGKDLGGWLTATLLQALAVSLVVALALGVLAIFGIRLPNTILFAVIAGVTSIIPVIGGFFGFIPPALAALTPNPINALWVAITVFVAQQVVFQGLGPILVSKSVNLHQASLLAGVLVFSALFGPIGAFLAVPFLLIIKTLYEELYVPSLGGRDVTHEEVGQLVSGVVPKLEDDEAKT